MNFVLFVEGATEHRALGGFLQRWLNPRLKEPVGIRLVDLEGWSKFHVRLQRKITAELDVPHRKGVIAGIGLLDLYGPDFYPQKTRTVSDRYSWAVNDFESKVGRGFRMFFAVHETEAWLLGQPDIFPAGAKERLDKLKKRPETVNFTKPPSKRIGEAYRLIKRTYRKTIDGPSLFSKANPETAYDRCPYLKQMLDTMLNLARQAGL